MARGAIGASQQIFDRAIGDQTATALVPTHTFSGNFVSGTMFPLLPNQSVLIFNASAQLFVLEAPGTGVYIQSLNIYVQFYDSSKNPLSGPVIVLAGQGFAAQSLTVNGALLNGAETGLGLSVDGDPVMELVSNMLFTGTVQQNGPAAAFFAINAAFDCYNATAGSLTPYAIVSSLHSTVPR